MEEAGADALEVNVYSIAADPTRTPAGTEVEDETIGIVTAVRDAIDPVRRQAQPVLQQHGQHRAADRRRGRRRPRAVQPLLPARHRPRRARGRPTAPRAEPTRRASPAAAVDRDPPPPARPRYSIAATSGVHSGTDVVKAVMVGADVAMLTSAVLRHGADHLRIVEAELETWMAEHDYDSVSQLRGSATQSTSGDPAAFERDLPTTSRRCTPGPLRRTSATRRRPPDARARDHLTVTTCTPPQPVARVGGRRRTSRRRRGRSWWWRPPSAASAIRSSTAERTAAVGSARSCRRRGGPRPAAARPGRGGAARHHRVPGHHREPPGRSPPHALGGPATAGAEQVVKRATR